jgi:ribonuclease J
MLQLVRPQIVVPVHGEARHVREHCLFAKSLGVPHTIAIDDGAMVRLSPDGPEVVDHVAIGRLAQDGPRLIRLDSEILRDRRRMVFNGSAVCTVVVDKKGKLVTDPQITALGLLDEDHYVEEHDAVVDMARDAFEELPLSARLDNSVAQEAIRRAVRRTLKEMLGHKPITTVHLVRI